MSSEIVTVAGIGADGWPGLAPLAREAIERAEVIIGGWPFPVDLRARAPRLKWFHQRQAGASNLLGSDLWGSDVVVTTSRGAANSLPIAEYAIAGILHFAMGFNRAAIDREAWEAGALGRKSFVATPEQRKQRQDPGGFRRPRRR